MPDASDRLAAAEEEIQAGKVRDAGAALKKTGRVMGYETTVTGFAGENVTISEISHPMR